MCFIKSSLRFSFYPFQETPDGGYYYKLHGMVPRMIPFYKGESEKSIAFSE